MATTKSCIVPNCENSECVSLPLDLNVQQKWFDILGIKNVAISSSTSCICLKHLPPAPEELEDLDSSDDEENAENHEIPSEICRLCMENDATISIFDNFNKQHTIKSAILTTIPSLDLSENDGLSQIICESCLKMLRFFYKFRRKCLHMDTIQRENNKKRKFQSTIEMNTNDMNCKRTRPSSNDEISNEIKLKLEQVLQQNFSEDFKHSDSIIIQVESDQDDDLIEIDKKEIKIVHSPKPVNIYPVEILHDTYDTEYYLINKYLFQISLSKGQFRHLTCLVSKCPALAIQTIYKGNVYKEEALLEKPHNHTPPTPDGLKVQMFYDIIKRKIIHDKSKNLRIIYDEVSSKYPEIKNMVSLKSVINEICSQQLVRRMPHINSFQQFCKSVESDYFKKLHFTADNCQFFQEKFLLDNGDGAVVFADRDFVSACSVGKILYIDSSFRINAVEDFKYYLLTVLTWNNDSYYPIMFALISDKSAQVYKTIFQYLRMDLAPDLNPDEIVTDFEANLYYSLIQTYPNCVIGGSVFHYIQNIYKKVCALNLVRDLETNVQFKNIYHMVAMLPLLPVNIIVDALNYIVNQAKSEGLEDLSRPLLDYVRSQWIVHVTPDLFCAHLQENRLNENIVAPFKKLRDFLTVNKSKTQKQVTISTVVEKLVELEVFLKSKGTTSKRSSYSRDLHCFQKKYVLRAWQHIENHPRIDVNNFFSKICSYIKCLENQLWIWGLYRYNEDASEELINGNVVKSLNENQDASDEDNVELDLELKQDDSLIENNPKFEPVQFQNAYLSYVNKN